MPEASTPHIRPGYRFALKHDVDRFPNFVAKQGSTGTVSEIQDNGLVVGHMDDYIAGAEDWNNRLWWKDGLPEFLADTAPLIPDGW